MHEIGKLLGLEKVLLRQCFYVERNTLGSPGVSVTNEYSVACMGVATV